MGKVLAIAQTKGGVGKTTLALQLALTLAGRGLRVWMVDGDRQQTAQSALEVRPEDLPAVAVSAYTNGLMLRRQVMLQRDNFDAVIIDVGGHDSETMRAAMSVCDSLLVPFTPRGFDVWALGQLCSVVDEVAQARGPFPVLAVLNCADSVGTDNAAAIEALSDYPELKYLDCPLKRRKAFAFASCAGKAVGEMRPKDSKAVAEIDALACKLFDKQEG